MSSQEHPANQSRRWKAEQICLVFLIVINVAATFAVIQLDLARERDPAKARAAVVQAIVFPGSLVLIPAAILWLTLRPDRVRVLKATSTPGPEHGEVTISSDEALPPACVNCGVATRRVTRLIYEHAEAEEGRETLFLLPMTFFRFVTQLARASKWSTSRHHEPVAESPVQVTFQIPHCRKCAASRPIMQRHFDFHTREMRVEAHHHFLEALDAEAQRNEA